MYRQQGFALIFMLMLILAGSSYILFSSWKEDNQYDYPDPGVTAEALAQAREALMGRMLSDDSKRGSLPCPDNYPLSDALSGSASTFSGWGCPSYAGRFPWRTLGLTELKDNARERLWYFLSPRFIDRNANNWEINYAMDMTSDEVLLGVPDTVAVIVAPGFIQNGQSRPSNDIADYMNPNAENADGDQIYDPSGAIDDTLKRPKNRYTVITQLELFTRLEEMLLGQVFKTMIQYKKAHGAYPWLVPFQNPSNDAQGLIATPGTREGLLPFFVAGQTFNTDLQVSWDLSNATVSASGTLNTTDMEKSVAPININGGTCQWIENSHSLRDVKNCQGTATISSGLTPPVSSRVYSFTAIDYENGINSLQDPTDTSLRTRTVTTKDAPNSSNASFTVTVTDYDSGGVEIGSGSLSLDTFTTGSITVSKISQPLLTVDSELCSSVDCDTNSTVVNVLAELPEWFIRNDWHRFMYVAIAAATAPGATATGCPANCLKLDIRAGGSSLGVENNIQIIILLANWPYNSQSRHSANLSDYYENHNASSGDDRFVRVLDKPNSFNDLLRGYTVEDENEALLLY